MPSNWHPDTRQRLQRGTRFFARLQAFDLECPACGKVFVIRKRTNVAQGGGIPPWDNTTARFKCGQCGRNYVLGIVAWPIATAPKAASATPTDQVAFHRQLCQMRKEGGGWWMAQDQAIRHGRPTETNLKVEEDDITGDDDDE